MSGDGVYRSGSCDGNVDKHLRKVVKVPGQFGKRALFAPHDGQRLKRRNEPIAARVVIQEEDMSRADIVKLMKGAEGLLESRFNRVLSVPGRNFKTARLREEQQSQPNWVGEDQTKMNKNHTLYLRREQWTTYSLDNGDTTEAVMAVFLDDVTVCNAPV